MDDAPALPLGDEASDDDGPCAAPGEPRTAEEFMRMMRRESRRMGDVFLAENEAERSANASPYAEEEEGGDDEEGEAKGEPPPGSARRRAGAGAGAARRGGDAWGTAPTARLVLQFDGVMASGSSPCSAAGAAAPLSRNRALWLTRPRAPREAVHRDTAAVAGARATCVLQGSASQRQAAPLAGAVVAGRYTSRPRPTGAAGT
ncbi:hypothetical protein SO694_00064119 [Aureococcus anophagefferens]|uniref:Uncharacterized protein n=1 Tax=Aureococcus anophagefferens TaxID=44056 RepID=A0ABR1FQN4_AURAN